MYTAFLKIASFLAAFSVAAGAFGAHSLKEANVTDEAMRLFETAVRYQFYHVLGIFIVAFAYQQYPRRTVVAAGWLFLAGIVLFSGSLYFLTWIKAAVKPGYGLVGVITPVGGLAFIAGWLCLFSSFFKKKTG